MSKSVHCFIYKCQKKADTYIYLPKENDFSDVPESLINAMGETELVMELDIDESRKLALTSGKEVLKSIEEQGFFLQVPPRDFNIEEIISKSINK